MNILKKKKVIKILIVVCVVSFIVWGGYAWITSGNSEEIQYKTATATKGNIQAALSVDGKIVFDTWNLEFLNSGVVKDVNVELGDIIKKNQVLAILDASNETDRVAQSQAEWNLAIATRDRFSKDGVDYQLKKKAYSAAKDKLEGEEDLYDKYKDEFGKDSTQAKSQKIKVTSAESDVKISKKQLEQIEVSYNNSRYQIEKSGAAYNQSLQAYDDYKITAPVDDAMVAQINGAEGSVVINSNNSSTEPFIVLVDPNSFWFEAYVEDVEALVIKQDMQAYITLDAYPNDEFKGKVIFVSPVAELDSNDLATYKVIIDVDNTEKALLDDMFGGVKLVSQEVRDIIKIPSEAVINKNGGQYVIIKTENGFEEKEVQIGFTNGKEVEIKKGLKNGEAIVIIK